MMASHDQPGFYNKENSKTFSGVLMSSPLVEIKVFIPAHLLVLSESQRLGPACQGDSGYYRTCSWGIGYNYTGSAYSWGSRPLDLPRGPVWQPTAPQHGAYWSVARK